jgi:DNA-binding CsgD family transcriptional regulator
MSIAFQRSISGTAGAADMVALVNRTLAEAPIEVLVTEGQLIELATGVLFATDDLLEEVSLLTRAIDAVQEAGSFAKIGLYSAARAYPEIPTGRLSDAIADAQAGIRAAEFGWEAFYPAACAYQALAHTDRGDLPAAEEVLSIDPARWAMRADWITVLIARGRLFAAQGDPHKAIGELRAAGEFAAMAGFRNPGPPDWRSWLAVALAQVQEQDEARSVASEALDVARAWGARWPIGTALRAAGIAEGGSAGIDLLREAVANLEASPARLKLARANIELGAALRRHGSLGDARETLRRGMDLAHRCGADALVAQSREELKAAGARPRRYALSGIEALTPAEGRVANLAATGRTNREIAQALFVTPKAVEYHLANAYRKLGIGSRHELWGAVARNT